MKIASIAVLGFAAAMFAAPHAHAYLDPGTGSMLIQGLIAAVAAAGVVARLYWHRLMVFLGLRRPLLSETESPTSEADRKESEGG